VGAILTGSEGNSIWSWIAKADRFDLLMAGIAATLLCCDLILAQSAQMSGLRQMSPSLLVVAFWAAIYASSHAYGVSRVEEIARLNLWIAPLSFLLNFATQIAARTNVPLVDAQLSAFDATLGISTAAICEIAAHWPKLRVISNAAYVSLVPMMIAAVLIPALLGRKRAPRRFLLSAILAALMSIVLFSICPAAGPWTVQPLKATQEQANTTAYLHLLKLGNPIHVEPDLAAIISFPSYHAALALLSGIALWNLRWLRPLTVLLTAAICVSTVTTGWHYGVDVLGGLLVAVVAHWMAGGIVDWTFPHGRDCAV
jgi:hypothetical protein